MRSGNLTKRAGFLQPVESRDGDGQIVQGHQHQFTVWANLKPLRGGESVMQARMTAKAPAILTIRASIQSRRIASDWRVVIDGRTYELKERPRMTQDRAWFEMLVEAVGS